MTRVDFDTIDPHLDRVSFCGLAAGSIEGAVIRLSGLRTTRRAAA